MKESFRFLGPDGDRVFVALHEPPGATNHAVVMCHPLGEEKLWSHRVFVTCARALADAGFAVMRLDFRGEGDSDRPFEESSLSTRVADVRIAVESLRAQFPSVRETSLIGLRFGAAVAAVAATRLPEVTRLVLWDPVTDGAAYMQSVLRMNLMYQMAQHHKVVENRDALVARLTKGETVNIEGYALAEPLFREACEFRLKDLLAQFGRQTLAIQINQGDAEMRAEIAALAREDGRCRVTAVREEAFWKEIKTFYRQAPELTRLSREFLEART